MTKKYMVLASLRSNERNLELIEFDLDKEQADEVATNLQFEEDVESVVICTHGQFKHILPSSVTRPK